MSITTKTEIVGALYLWIAQRPGLDFHNYGDIRRYRAEMRRIQRDLADARALIRAVELSSIEGEHLLAAMRGAYSGRLTWTGRGLDYCTGQYWPTEYRAAVCAVCASALWRHYAADAPANGGKELRARMRRMFGRGIASRWFS